MSCEGNVIITHIHINVCVYICTHELHLDILKLADQQNSK